MLEVKYLKVLAGLLMLATLTACSVAQLVLPATPTPTPLSTPTPAPTPTLPYAERIQEIEASWQQTDALARSHMASDQIIMTCETCHPAGADAEVEPENSICIECHGGDIESVRTMTDEQGEEIHPFGHLTNAQCSSCHWPHKELDDPCALCH